MKFRRHIGVAAATALMCTIVGGTPAQAKPVTVMEDTAGDAGNDTQPIPGMEQTGTDLISGTIEKQGKDIVFTVTHAVMPPVGSFPEGARLLYHFSVDGEQYRFTVKSLDIGKPDVIAMTGTERVGQVYTNGVYRLETCAEMAAGITFVNCTTIEELEGAFDVAAKSVSWNLPMATVKAKTGSLIAGGTAWAAVTSCQICWVPHYAERSLTPVTIIDFASQSVVYKVPKK